MIGKNAEDISRVIGCLAVVQYPEIVPRTRAEPGVAAEWQGVGIFAAKTVLVTPGQPAAAVETADPALGAEPDDAFTVDRNAVDPLVDQFLDVGFEFAGFAVQVIGAGPGADPQSAVPIVGKGVNPVVGEPVHREVGFPVTVAITRHAAGIGAEPLVAVAVDADAEHVFVGEPMITGKGIDQPMGSEVDLVDAEGSSDPQPVRLLLDCQRAHVNVGADVEYVQHLRQVCRRSRLRRNGL